MSYKIDNNKNIGTVIFVVEGGRRDFSGTELKLLKIIFSDILKYEVQELCRGNDEFIGHGKNKFSRVFALNLPKNQLTQLTETALDELFSRLRKEFKIRPEDCPIFFLYDRDYLSYKPNELRNQYVMKYTDPYGNKNGDQGQLLLSYPSVESFFLSAVEKDAYRKRFFLGSDIKKYNSEKGISLSSIKGENELLNALEEMEKGLLGFSISGFDLDDLGPTLLNIYDKEQELYKGNKEFSSLSCISFALLELGIVVKE